MSPRPAHRPTKFTEDARERYLQAAGLGLPPPLCRQAAGWAKSTALAYLARGDAAREARDLGHKLAAVDARFADFVDEIEKVEARWAQGLLAIVLREAQKPGNWMAAMALVERRWPEHFGRRYVEHAGPGGGRIPVEVTADEVLGQLREIAGGSAGRRLRALPAPGPGGNGDQPQDDG